MEKPILFENEKIKLCCSKEYNFYFDKLTGFFARWGKTKEDDPDYSPYGPEICDMEISTVCHGINNKPCIWCYKSNTGKGHNMSFENFKNIFHKLPKTLTQIAFGIGDIDGNPDLWKILDYCRNNEYNHVVPNITINGWNLKDEYVEKLSKLCGAIAVSKYTPKDICYDAIKKFTDKNFKQINIHMLISKETYEDCLQTIKDVKTDFRLTKLNALVFLSLKPKGKRNNFTCLKDPEKYKNLIDLSFKEDVIIGFDSCSAPMFLKAVTNYSNYKQLKQLTEPCESFIFSLYINCKGEVTPCSFAEGKEKPTNILEIKNFLKEIWFNNGVIEWRKKLLATEKCNICRKCPIYDIY